MNLAVNARDAMASGGRITIATSQHDLDDEFVRSHWPATPGRYALLTISDTGVGMDEATKGRIFEPFFTTKEVGKGTGLGLATVYGIVKQSRGFIWLYSEPGQGTVFKLYFPVAAGESTRPATAPPIHPRRGSETVLLVEDDDAVRTVARHILERYGYAVTEAAQGEVALRLAARPEIRVDLLLTDLVMPGMTGRELSERFSLLRPDTPVIFMSGYTDDAILRQGVLEPGMIFLQKPFTPVSLARMVGEVLGRQ
jgi:CheY-like chemotaxis protein